MSGKLDSLLAQVKIAVTEAHQTERVRIGSRAKVVVGIASAIAAALGAITASMAGCA